MNPWPCPFFRRADRGLLLSKIFVISVNLVISFPWWPIKQDRLVIASMCLHTWLTPCTHPHLDADIALANDCSEHDCAGTEDLQIHSPKTISVWLLSLTQPERWVEIITGAWTGWTGKCPFVKKSMLSDNHILFWSGRGYHNSVAQELKSLFSKSLHPFQNHETVTASHLTLSSHSCVGFA